MGWMKRGCALINTARGPIVNEQDLEEGISSGRIVGLFDVFWEEPYSGPLTNYSPWRFRMSPHIASTCDKFLLEAAKDFKLFVEGVEK